MDTLHSLFGLASLTALAWLFSENRRAAPQVRVILAGLGLQLALALLLLKVPGAQHLFELLNAAVSALLESTQAGTRFVFGYLAGGDTPWLHGSNSSSFILGIQALPLILVMSALSALLFHWRVLPVLVRGFAWGLRRTLGVNGALGLGAAANIFVGMVEAPLLIRPYLARLSRSDLFALMTVGMATSAGTMLALYVSLIGPVVPDAAGHILTASLISAPAALLVARLMVPPGDHTVSTEIPTTGALDSETRSAMDAITRGTIDGLRLLAQVIAMLIVLVALVHLANTLLGVLPPMGGAPLTLERMLGQLLAPLAWLTGIDWAEAGHAGALIGTKTVLNEVVAYLQLAALPPEALSERARTILTYSLCGFANLGSLGIMIGGMGAMAPERRSEIVALGLRSIVAGTLATLMTGTVAGLMS
ncbi:MAG: NupC/NupG family nucleoside CNT transporter [Gammaproteobacteria bacterium]